MKPSRYRPALLALLIGAASLAGCATPGNHPAKASGTDTANANSAPAATTGIPACDAYLASYVACHRAAAIFPPDQIQAHYQDMQASLVHDSLDPTIRPQLGARCTLLTQQLKQVLHGQSCSTAHASSAASNSR
ncbi:hypothetical protein [Dyella sp. RRB7]|uniref:hypothetical protein n=1 Tax=Dyella sp. RRB7 TaxID=2919502 RepID=UPI001FAA150B|nr:hypothetical protein [Dyella sp. RRB7]